MLTSVYLRGLKKETKIQIGNNFQLDNEREIIEKWQDIVDLIAEIIEVPSALIMRITSEKMEVFLKDSGKDNPYEQGGSDNLCHGLYCETVVGLNKELLIDNALKYKEWKDNPDVDLNMISYYGLPIKWPDKNFFGTICILDSKENSYNDKFKKLIKEFRDSLERDLVLITQKKALQALTEIDSLTSVYNRRKIDSIIENEFNRSKRTGKPFSIAIFDLNKFKSVNDNYGHNVGDELLKMFSEEVNKRIRVSDYFGRIGGDEFMLICPNTKFDGVYKLINELKDKVFKKMDDVIQNDGFCCGVAEFRHDDTSKVDLYKRADINLYLKKKEEN